MAIARDAVSPSGFFLVTPAASDDPVGTSASFDAPDNCVLTACMACDTAAGVTPTPAVTNNGTALTWTQRVLRGDAEGTAGVVAIYTAVITGGARSGLTVTVSIPNIGTNTTGNAGFAWVDVWTGVDTTTPTGNVGENSSTTNSITPNAVTTSAAGSRVLGVGGDWAGSGTPTSTDTADGMDSAGRYSGVRVYKAANTTSSGTLVTLNFDAAGTAAADWNWAALELLAGAGGGGPVSGVMSFNRKMLRPKPFAPGNAR